LRGPDHLVSMPKDSFSLKLKMRITSILTMRFSHRNLELEAANACSEEESISGMQGLRHSLPHR
jgi:hypothetical protein